MFNFSPEDWHTIHVGLNYVAAAGLIVWLVSALHLSTRPPVWSRREYGRMRFHAVSAAVQGTRTVAYSGSVQSDTAAHIFGERPSSGDAWRARDPYVSGIGVIPPVTAEPQLNHASEVTGIFGSYADVQAEAKAITTPTAGWDLAEIFRDEQPDTPHDPIVYAEVLSPPQGMPIVQTPEQAWDSAVEEEAVRGWDVVEAEVVVEPQPAEEPEPSWRDDPLSPWMPLMPEDEEYASLATLTFDDFLNEGRITPLGALGSLVSADMDSWDYKHNQETLRLGAAELGMDWDVPAELVAA